MMLFRSLMFTTNLCRPVYMRRLNTFTSASQRIDLEAGFIRDLVHEESRSVGSSMDAILETVAGIDELSLMEHVDKAHFLCFVPLKNVNEINVLPRTRLLQILNYAKIPNEKFLYLEQTDLRALTRNLMLVIVEKMSHRELSSQLARINWTTMESFKDQLREALRLWVQYPQFKGFEIPCTRHTFFTQPINDKYVENMRLFYEYEIRQMSKERLEEQLRMRSQDSRGTEHELRERFLAFQEFIVMRVMNEKELKTFLTRHYLSCGNSKNYAATSILRKRVIQHLKYPNDGRILSKFKPETTSDTQKPSLSVEEIFHKSYNEAGRLMKRSILDNPDVKVGAIEQAKLSNMIPSQVKVDLNILSRALPIHSKISDEKYWSYDRDMVLRNGTVNFWYFVSCVASYHYGLNQKPAVWESYYNKIRLRLQNTMSQPSVDGVEIIPDFTKKLVLHSDIDALTNEDAAKLLLQQGRNPSFADYLGNKEHLKRIQDTMISLMDRKDVQRIQDDFCLRVYRKVRVLRRSIKDLVRDPFDCELITPNPSVNVNIVYSKELSAALESILYKEKCILQSPKVEFNIDISKVFKDCLYRKVLSFAEIPLLLNVLNRRYNFMAERESLEVIFRMKLPWVFPKTSHWFRKQDDGVLNNYYRSCFNDEPSGDVTKSLLEFQDLQLQQLNLVTCPHVLEMASLPMTESPIDTLRSWLRNPEQVLKGLEPKNASPKWQIWKRSTDQALTSIMSNISNILDDYSNNISDSEIWSIVSHHLSMESDECRTPNECRDRWVTLQKVGGSTQMANQMQYPPAERREKTKKEKKEQAIKDKYLKQMERMSKKAKAVRKETAMVPRQMSILRSVKVDRRKEKREELVNDIWTRIKNEFE